MTWVLRVPHEGGRRDLVLGQFPALGIAEARRVAKAEKARQKKAGSTPVQVAAKPAVKAQPTFADCVARYIKSHRAEWSPRHADNWTQTMEAYAGPVIGKMPVGKVDTDSVMAILEPIWATKTETASRVRGRIEAVLDWAKVQKLRSGENPARWRGHLSHLLPEPAKIAPVVHREALPYAEMPDFFAALARSEDHAAVALQFTILTATRSNEAREAVWSEVDLTECEWIIPAARMKASREHRVPLSEPASLLVAKLDDGARKGAAFIFPGGRAGRPLSGMAFPRLLDDLGFPNLTTHGFRSTFRDWAAETTDFPNEVVEMALAHAIGSKVEAAYRRGNLLAKRRALMDEWGRFCVSKVELQ